jgi:hypothetical protein
VVQVSGNHLRMVGGEQTTVYAELATTEPVCECGGDPVIEGPVCTCAQVGSAFQTSLTPLLPVTVSPKVEITTADIISDQIVVSLSPSTASGGLLLTLASPDGNVTLLNEARSGGTHTFSFNPTALPARQFTEVRAAWTVNGVTGTGKKAASFRVLGTYLHSQYNTPRESLCTGAPERAYITNAMCNFTATTLRSDFIRQVNLNGSSRSINFGDVVREFFCVAPPRVFPPDAPDRSFRQQSIRPACSGQVLNDTTVARAPNHRHLGCGDRVLIVGLGRPPGTVKTVTDLCPGCREDQLDNYTTDERCSGITHLGHFVTIRLR